MPKKYKIRQGFTFVQDDRTVLSGDDTIWLDDDVYRAHAHKLEFVELNDSPVVQTSAKAKAPPAPRATPDAPAADAASADAAQ